MEKVDLDKMEKLIEANYNKIASSHKWWTLLRGLSFNLFLPFGLGNFFVFFLIWQKFSLVLGLSSFLACWTCWMISSYIQEKNYERIKENVDDMTIFLKESGNNMKSGFKAYLKKLEEVGSTKMRYYQYLTLALLGLTILMELQGFWAGIITYVICLFVGGTVGLIVEKFIRSY
jgi:hypothetical protein